MGDLSVNLGKRIRILRTAIGISQEELAFKAGISAAHLGLIERAAKNPTIDTVEKISTSLQVSIPTLFAFQDQPSETAESATINKILAHLASMSEAQQKDVLRIIKILKSYNLD